MLRLHQLNYKQSKQNYFQVTASSSTMSEAQPSVLIGCYSENNVSFGESKLSAPSLSNYFYNCCSTQDTKPGAQEANQDPQKGQMSTKTSKTVLAVQSGVRWEGSVCTAAKHILQEIWREKYKYILRVELHSVSPRRKNELMWSTYNFICCQSMNVTQLQPFHTSTPLRILCLYS